MWVFPLHCCSMGSIGTLSFPPYVLHYALCFLDGPALTVFETASTGAKQVVDDTPGLYKTLLVRCCHTLLLAEGVSVSPTFAQKAQHAATCCCVVKYHGSD